MNDNNEIVDITPTPSQPQAVNGSNSLYNKIVDPIQAIEKMGEMIWASGMFGCVKPEQGMVLAMQCLAEGKAPLELAKTYHIVEGKLTMRADAMLGRYLSSGGKVKWLARTDTEVKAVFIKDDNEVEICSNIEDFKKNGIALSKSGGLKDNWKKFPRQMLTARTISEGVRLLAPQIIAGIYTPEEMQDINDRPAPRQVSTTQVFVEERKPAIAEENARDNVNARLTDLLGKYEPYASEYLIAKSYLKSGENFLSLDAMTATRILANPSKIISILEGLKAGA
jgi:hypothetical protein